MEDKELKIYDIIAQWLTHYEFNFSQLGKVRNEEEINKLKVAEKEVKDLEKFTRLVSKRKIDVFALAHTKSAEEYNKIWDSAEYCLTEDEFNFAKEMIEKYGK